MGVTPIRIFNSIKLNLIGGMANNPVEFGILRNHFADSICCKLLAFLEEYL